MKSKKLLGIGLYTSSEASRLLDIPAGRITRWLRGHIIKGKSYEPLWTPQIDIGDDKVYLGFRDLLEMRTAHAFMHAGVSAIAIRKAILEARKYVADERPLSTTKFKTDGLSIFLEIASETGDPQLLDLFKKQYAFKRIIEASLKDVEFDGIAPIKWWPRTKHNRIVIDPERSFGQPIEEESGVPTAALSAAAKAEGSEEKAARLWLVTPRAVRRAVEFEKSLHAKAA